MAVLGVVVAAVLAAWTTLLFVPLRWRPAGLFLFVPRMLAQAWSPFLGVAGVGVLAWGMATGSWWTVGLASLAIVETVVVVVRVGAVPVDLDPAFGSGWDGAVPPAVRRGWVGRRWRGRLPTPPPARMQADVAFARVPGTGEVLLCDVWEPPTGVRPSGVGVVYLHSSAWTVFDKDAGTRPLFTHLAAQGHVVVDVAYRLFPDADIPGMVADARRAVAWLRMHADHLGVDPERIVLAGGSAGGHLALLAAYTRHDPDLAAPELVGPDLGVAAVAALYAQADLAAMYEATDQAHTARPDDPQPDWDAPAPPAMVRLLGADAARYRLHLAPYAGRCDWLLGGTPEEVPEVYERLSPLDRVHEGAPATLVVHGRLDMMAPPDAIRRMEVRLRAAHVPTVAVELPHTDHAFDLVGTAWSPPARVAIAALERFLAAVATRPTGPAVAEARDRARA